MATKVASLFAEIGADTSGLKRGLDDSQKGLKKFGGDFKKGWQDLIAPIGAVTAGIFTLKKAWDFGKEGAQLVYTKGKFDNLASSIFTTSDALLNDLKRATRGTVSDMDLVRGATDFMSLGLAKSHAEVVRLTRVAGALGMNMNQLVLTLTNRTTMRFDALGVAVDGFDEKVKALEKSGLSVEEAFTEAFLQQAEEQLEKVGDVADTTAGDIMRAEVAVGNLADTLKMKAAPAIADFAILLTDLLTLDAENWFQDGADASAKFVNKLSDASANFINNLFGMQEEVDAFDTSSFTSNISGITREIDAFDTSGYTAGISHMDDVTKQLAETIHTTVLGIKELTAIELAREAIDQFREAEEKNIITTEEMNLAILAIQTELMGVPPEAIEAQQKMDSFFNRLDSGEDDIYGTVAAVVALKNSIDSLKDKTVKINVLMSTNQPGLIASGVTGKQHGGPAYKGHAYVVGEAGPEIFVPNQSGHVIPNSRIHGSPGGGGMGGGIGGEGGVIGGNTFIEQHFHNEATAALGLAMVFREKRQRLNASMGG